MSQKTKQALIAFLPALFGAALCILVALATTCHAAECSVERPLPPPAAGLRTRMAAILAPVAADSPTTLDLMLVYSSAARDAQGGDAAMQAFCRKVLDRDNLVMANSKTGSQFRLVYCGVSPIAESGNIGADLSLIHQNPEIAAKRNAVGADFCQLIVQKSGSSIVGTGYLMVMLGQWFAGNAFSVVKAASAYATYSSIHELGHNMGCDHNPQSSSGGGILPFSFGFGKNGTGDVLCYGVTRLPILSVGTRGPFLYNGKAYPMGNSGCDNISTVRYTSATCAAFRKAIK